MPLNVRLVPGLQQSVVEKNQSKQCADSVTLTTNVFVCIPAIGPGGLAQVLVCPGHNGVISIGAELLVIETDWSGTQLEDARRAIVDGSAMPLQSLK